MIVTRVAQSWVAALARILSWQRIAPAAERLLTELKELVTSACAEDPFRAMFVPIESHASQLYGAAWRPARLTVAHTRSHPRGAEPAEDPYALTAVTPWPPDPLAAEIELQIYCAGFGPAAYAAMPMLLTHECVCHVPARQERAKNDSQFAEGFLDWAAYHFFGIWAAKLDRQLASAARKHADRLRQILTWVQTTEGRARLAGHDAAEQLRVWFEAECGMTPEESRTQVARLAVELNQVDRPIAVKDHFVSLLDDPLPPSVAATLQAWVDGHAQARDLLDLRAA